MNFSSELAVNPVFKTVVQAARKQGCKAYIVGGYVRDLILERPNKDVDFVCVGSGIAWAEEVASLLGGLPVTIFRNFGTAMIRYGEYDLEFVGARKESYRQDSRKPLVEDGTLEDDQQRRDFTINAMAISLNEGDFGELIDPFKGTAHLKDKMIKTPLDPAITFSDDPLRMMRAIRFASQLAFDIDPDTFQSIIDQKERIRIVSMERIVEELNKIILSPVPSYGFKLLFHSGLLHQFFPEMVALHGVEYVDNKAHKDNFYHTLQVLDNVSVMSYDLWLRWAAILHDIAKPLTKRFEPGHGWTFHGHEDKGARMVPGMLPIPQCGDSFSKLAMIRRP
jgi:poly(A) polymerase